MKDVNFLKTLLGSNYRIEKRPNGYHLSSKTGIDDEHKWNDIVRVIKSHFKNRFSEIFHQTNFNHQEFTIYLI